MRIVANIKQPNSEVKRLMIYESDEGVYLFGYKTIIDAASDWDEFYDSLEDAKERAQEKFEVNDLDWNAIPDPQENCKHDWIEPVRIDDN